MARRKADVIPLHAPRAATRLGPREARRVALAARKAGLAPGHARDLLEFLLRFADPRRGLTVNFTRARLIEELDAAESTVKRAVRALRVSGLVAIVPGDGRRETTFTIDAAEIAILLGELPEVWRGKYPVHQGELPLIEGGQNDPPEGSERPPTRAKMTPQGGQNQAPNARARTYAREIPPITSQSPNPPSTSANGFEVADPPPSGQGPPRFCEHGLSSCRACGTNPRSQAAARAREELMAADQQRRERLREQARERQRERENAVTKPPEFFDAIRAEITKNLKSQPSKEKPVDEPHDC